MNTAELIRRAEAAGLELRLDGGQVKIKGPQSAMDAWLARLRQHKTELVGWLTTRDPGPVPMPEPPSDPGQWRELAQAYHLHHFACRFCIAAGRNDKLLRCGTGSALWSAYQPTVSPK